MKKKLWLSLAVTVVMLLVGCQPSDKDTAVDKAHIYSTVYSGEVTTINYLVTSTTSEFGLAANLVDTLIDYDRFGMIQPALAESWNVSDDGLTWTFKIRPGVKWYTWEGKEYAEVVAQDFVDALEYVFNPDNGSKTANIAYRVLKNAEDYYNGEINDFSKVGVKARDKYTLEYTLSHPVPYFLSMLNYSVFFPVNGKFLQEVGDRFGTDNKNLLYNGAYIMTTFEPQSKRILTKNANYWNKDNVFIEELNYTFNQEAATIGPELYLRGEISSVGIASGIIDEWMNDPEKKVMVRPARASFYSYFYAFNFDPKFDSQYEPENWKVAVNNGNFRKSLFHALDRVAAQLTADPYFPENRLSNTVTPVTFVSLNGVDYTQIGDLAIHANTDPFEPGLALAYKKLAMQELKGKVKFPVKVVMPYNTGSTDWTNRVQLIEQQMENLLGKDYIDIIPLAHPPTGFLNGTRRIGNYSMQECNWGPDYADPETFTDPFARGGTYNFPEYTTEVNDDGVNLFVVYEEILEEAIAEVVDLQRRYELFAKAEAFIIENAWVLPYGLGGGGYVSSKLDPFEAPFSPFGVAGERWTGQKILEVPMSSEDYEAALKKWEEERAKVLQ